ncbi:hypothetical protein GGR54DRAFT_647967 [Hypoxylon sp. NC1633]|nr:hypothetical protein GGR54DRAFT_647967 [Hypoxylon sp. NC1633]
MAMTAVNRIPRVGSVNLTLSSRNITSLMIKSSRFSTSPRKRPRVRFCFTAWTPVKKPQVPRLLLNLSMIRKAAGMSNKEWHKSLYIISLNYKLQDVELREHIKRLRQEHTRLLHRYKLIERREEVDVECGELLLTLKNFITWRREVVVARIAELEACEDGSGTMAKEDPLGSTWAGPPGPTEEKLVWNWLLSRNRT